MEPADHRGKVDILALVGRMWSAAHLRPYNRGGSSEPSCVQAAEGGISFITA